MEKDKSVEAIIKESKISNIVWQFNEEESDKIESEIKKCKDELSSPKKAADEKMEDEIISEGKSKILSAVPLAESTE
jgi:hypothetical protein